MASNGHANGIEIAPVALEQEIVTSPTMQATYNPNLTMVGEEIEANKVALNTTLAEIQATAERLTSLRVHEQTIRDRLSKLESDKRAILSIDTKARAQQITDVVLRDEDRMRHLQHEMEKIAAHKEQAETELHAVSTKGHTDGLIAGVPMSRIEHNQSKSRYELKARPVTSGLSHDTLAQTPADCVNAPAEGRQWGKKHEAASSSILDIGSHSSASPYVNPQDYVVEANRPSAANGSAKFSDWRSSSRSSTKIAQPPGGYSHMNSIFG